MVLHIFCAGVFENKSKQHNTIVQETRSLHNQKNVSYKIIRKWLTLLSTGKQCFHYMALDNS